MYLFKSDQFRQLTKNGTKPHQGADHIPVAKIARPDCIWLFTERDAENPNVLFGLKVSEGEPAVLTHIEIADIYDVDDNSLLLINYDFQSKYPISTYLAAMDFYGQLVEEEAILERFVKSPVKGTQLRLF